MAARDSSGRPIRAAIFGPADPTTAAASGAKSASRVWQPSIAIAAPARTRNADWPLPDRVDLRVPVITVCLVMKPSTNPINPTAIIAAMRK